MKTNSVPILFAVLFMVIIIIAPAADGNGKNRSGFAGFNLAQGAKDGAPCTQMEAHETGLIHMTITNFGLIGSLYSIDDEFGSYERLPSCEYPAESGVEYLYGGGLWVGAIVGDDTLVSVGFESRYELHEMLPAFYDTALIVRHSKNPLDSNYYPRTVSELDYIAVYYDTTTSGMYIYEDPFDSRPHIPLNIEVTQKSFSWSQPEFEDFIIFKYKIRNFGTDTLKRTHIGLYFDADAWHLDTPLGYTDDITGYKWGEDTQSEEEFIFAWAADNDGDPVGGEWNELSTPDVMGISFLELPANTEVSYNWWRGKFGYPAHYDWGPMTQDNYRDLGTGGLGTPEGDCNRYYIMANNELDYDQMFAAVDFTDSGWLPPTTYVPNQIADGDETGFVLSFGGVDLLPGDSLEFAFVIAMGEDFHQQPDDYDDLFDPADPFLYYNALDFDDLVANIKNSHPHKQDQHKGEEYLPKQFRFQASKQVFHQNSLSKR